MWKGAPVRTFACIVTYEPDLGILAENLRAVARQVDAVIVVDNGSENVSTFADELPESVVLNRLPANRGLSVAMNIAVQSAESQHAEFVLMLDQDSVVVPGLVATLLADLDENEDLAMVGPRIDDRNLESDVAHDGRGLERVNACITSGSLIRVDDWKRVGGWDEALFIDYVDFDFCLRLRSRGRAIGIDHRTALHHSIGDARRQGRATAWGHSAQRLERMAKDVLHYARKHRRSPMDLQVVPNRRSRALAVLARKALIIALHEDAKHAKIRALVRGSIQGLRSSVD
jgi:rhamnosyltransferase